MGGSTRLFLRLKDVIRKHPGWDDSQVARACGGHPVFDAQLVRAFRNYRPSGEGPGLWRWG